MSNRLQLPCIQVFYENIDLRLPENVLSTVIDYNDSPQRNDFTCLMARISPALNQVVENTNTTLCDIRHDTYPTHRDLQR